MKATMRKCWTKGCAKDCAKDWKDWRADATGAVAVEHVLIVSMIVVACIFGASAIGAKVDRFFGAIVNGLH